MRKLGSYLIILIFLTAYGRCVADQFGMLHSSEASCCLTICDTAEHCTDDQDDHSTDSDTPEQSTPCQLCFILNSDGMVIHDGFKVPAPNLLEISDFRSFCTTLDDLLRGRLIEFSQEQNQSGRPDMSADRQSHLLRIESKTNPVRGPSVA